MDNKECDCGGKLEGVYLPVIDLFGEVASSITKKDDTIYSLCCAECGKVYHRTGYFSGKFYNPETGKVYTKEKKREVEPLTSLKDKEPIAVEG